MQSNLVFKLCAVCSSLLLVAAFVSYRTGAFGWLTASSTPAPTIPTAPEYVGAGEIVPDLQAARVNTWTVNSTRRERFLWSSKSGAVFIDSEATPVVPQPQERPPDPVLFSGSKTLMPVPSSGSIGLAPESPEQQGQRR